MSVNFSDFDAPSSTVVSGLDEVVVVKLSSIVQPLSAMHGEPIFEEGRVGKEMYILIEGEVVVEKGASKKAIHQRAPVVTVRCNSIYSIHTSSVFACHGMRESPTFRVLLGGVELGYLTQPGSFFGENVVINPRSSETRSRTVKAVTDCILVYLEQEAVYELAEKYPELKGRLNKFSKLGMRRTRTAAQMVRLPLVPLCVRSRALDGHPADAQLLNAAG